MRDKNINGITYTNVIYEDEEFLIQYIKNPRKNGKSNNRYRVVNTNGKDNHTHLNNLGVCKKCIKFVKNKKLPLTAKKYLIMSCYRLSIDKKYKNEVMDLYEKKKNKQKYYYRIMKR